LEAAELALDPDFESEPLELDEDDDPAAEPMLDKEAGR